MRTFSLTRCPGSGQIAVALYVALFVAVGLIAQPLAAAELAISTDFPGGSAVLKELDAETGRIAIEPSHHGDHGWPCWWYFRVDGAHPGQALTLEVTASSQPFRPGKRLAATWALPHQPSISSDDVHWQHGEPGTPIKEGRSYSIVAPSEQFWVAWGPPFLPAHAEALIAETTAKLPTAERFVLAQTRGGRSVPAVRIGGPATAKASGEASAADARGAIWVQARQHAWESGSSWVGKGFLRWIASDEPAAVRLRATHEIFFVPIMDVDSVTIGAGGKEAIPRDHNRDWSDQPVYPEVAAAQAHIRELVDSGRLRVFLDLHNPSAGDKQPFFFGPLDYEQMPAAHRQLYDRFLELATEHIRGPLAIHPRYRFATYVTTEEERARVSGNWVRNYAGENVIAMTLETAWDTPHSTTDGYLGVGRGLAKTVASFLQQQAE